MRLKFSIQMRVSWQVHKDRFNSKFEKVQKIFAKNLVIALLLLEYYLKQLTLDLGSILPDYILKHSQES